MSVRSVLVCMDQRPVGEIAEASNHRYAFSYADSWLKDGFNISPFSLPLENGVFIASGNNFDGLFGVFADSLPDSWGRLLVDRMLSFRGINPSDVSPLERLCIVGDSGMGALSYRPMWDTWTKPAIDDLDTLCKACHELINRRETDDLDRLFALGGSSGGARPKLIGSEWIIKFPTSADMPHAGKMEKDYMDCAKSCGIDVPETRLYPSGICEGYFAVRRFDRDALPDGTLVRRHVLTAAALLELDWRTPSLDYHSLMKLTSILCAGSKAALIEMYRRMCFNVYAHNRDDHAKNFSFIFDEAKHIWRLSPAYDLTRSDTYFGEHTTTVDGNGKDPGLPELLSVGMRAGLSKRVCVSIAEEIEAATREIVFRYGQIGK